MSWVSYIPGQWSHRPWFKVWINTVLRVFQTKKRPARLLVLATICERTPFSVEDDSVPPKVAGYKFKRVLHI